MSGRQNWNPELYEARHAFVWQFGKGVLELLDPQAGERILDLGCGTGQLTNEISTAGANVIGLDSSPEMIGQARQNYPKLQFTLQDAATMRFESEFDAIFSNAALHWMLDAQGVADAMCRALKPGGRLIAELGGKGNIGHITTAIHSVLFKVNEGVEPVSKHYFPSVGEYCTVLERAGFEVRMTQLFDRPTPLVGENGMLDWLHQFAWYNFVALPAAARETAALEVVNLLRSSLYREDGWWADYRRLRIVVGKR